MHWAQALVFCGCLMGASIYDVRHRLVDDRVCVALVLAGLITISPASFLGALAGGLPFYLGAGFGKNGAGDTVLAASAGFVLGLFRTLAGLMKENDGRITVHRHPGSIRLPARSECRTGHLD